MIKITVEAEGKTSELKIEEISEQLLLTDIIPSIREGTPVLAQLSSAEMIRNLLSEMLRTFVRGRASLWKDK